MGNSWIEISCDDWVAVYINGKLEFDGHDIQTYKVIDLCNKYGYMSYKSIYIPEKEQEQYDLWDFPNDINNLPKEILDQIQ